MSGLLKEISGESVVLYNAGIHNLVAAFKDMRTKKVYLTGRIHDAERLPEDLKERVFDADVAMVSGFWDKDFKKFYTREEVKDMLSIIPEPKGETDWSLYDDQKDLTHRLIGKNKKLYKQVQEMNFDENFRDMISEDKESNWKFGIVKGQIEERLVSINKIVKRLHTGEIKLRPFDIGFLNTVNNELEKIEKWLKERYEKLR